MSGRKRLLYVGNNPEYFLSHRRPQAEAARDAGYEVHVAMPPDPDAERAITAAGYPFHPIALSRGIGTPWGEIRAIASFFRVYRAVRPDLVQHNTVKPMLYGGFAARALRVPAVVHVITGLGYVFLAEGPRAAIRRAAIKLAYRFILAHPRCRAIFQNPDDLGEFVRAGLVPEARTVLIKGSGVDVQAFTPTPEPPGLPVVLLPSRMLWDKGVGEFVEAARMLRDEGVEARFVLAGDTDMENPAGIPPARLHEWRDAGIVEWWGHQSDMPGVFARSHIVCLPSYREGLPKALIEGAASGRPIVTTDVPGCREVVPEGRNGLLAPVRDARALADALRRLCVDRELRARMGAASRKIAEEEFAVEGVARRHLEIYEALCPLEALSPSASSLAAPSARSAET